MRSRTAGALSLGAAVAVAALLSSVVPAYAQSTTSQLGSARRSAQRVRSEYERIAEAYSRQQDALGQTNLNMDATQTDIQRAQAEKAQLENKLKDRVRAAYQMGGLGFFEMLLDARSFRDFSLRYVALQRQSLSDEALILQLRRKQAELQDKENELQREQQRYASQAVSLRDQARRLTISFEQAQSLVASLQGRLRAEEIAKLFRVGGRGVGGYRIPLDACPVAGPHYVTNSFGAPRDGGRRRHQGNDIMAPYGTPIVAPVSGTVTMIQSGGNGGLAFFEWGVDHNEYYFAHESSISAHAGQSVSAGQAIANVGDSGNARGGAPHLHFEIHPGGGPAIDPYPSLSAVC